MIRYRAAFALGDGMWWDKANTFNARHNIETVDVVTICQMCWRADPLISLSPGQCLPFAVSGPKDERSGCNDPFC
ncbi:hypothetical protein [Symbiopectobacterium purcellii]|uniref:hypothetical protein n=1 Tax=Symbiopectobacterium purcellii TaxID=2871826 RepID=UPI0020766A34|nr:hypothetical protein [Symbiopectobacterium purcellii]